MDGMDGMDGMGWDGSPGGPRYRAPTVLIKVKILLKKKKKMFLVVRFKVDL